MLFYVVLISRGNTNTKEPEMYGKKWPFVEAGTRTGKLFNLLVHSFIIIYQKYVLYT
jgi:hypothetical protein